MFRRVSLVIMLMLLVTCVSFAEGINITLNGEAIEFTTDSGMPFIDENNRVLVPFRIVLEEIGANVRWESQSRIAVAVKDGVEVAVPVGQMYVLKNNEKILNDTYARIVDGRTYLPIRVVMEAFGYDVGWDSGSQTVLISNTGMDTGGEDAEVEIGENEPEEVFVANTIGNTNGNIYNEGVIVEEFNTIYYVNFKENEGIWSFDTKTKITKQLTDQPAKQLNVIDGVLYFLEENISNNYDAYSMLVDGSDKNLLGSSNSSYIGAFDSGVYYYNASDENLYFLEDEALYGDDFYDREMSFVQIVGDYLYYIEYDDDDENIAILKQLNLESLELKTIHEERVEDNENCILVYDDYVFYCKYNDAFSLYRMNLDGSNEIKLTDERVYSLITDGEHVYYLKSDFDKGIYRISIDGGDSKIIRDGWKMTSFYSPSFSLFDGNLYFKELRTSTKYDLYRIRLDSFKEIKISEAVDLID